MHEITQLPPIHRTHALWLEALRRCRATRGPAATELVDWCDLDYDRDADGICDALDALPDRASTPLPDFDLDGIPDSRDPDDDNDGVVDGRDPAPRNAAIRGGLDSHSRAGDSAGVHRAAIGAYAEPKANWVGAVLNVMG